MEEDDGIYGTALKVTHPSTTPTSLPPLTHHEVSISHISPDSISRFFNFLPFLLSRILTFKWFSVRKASVKFINLQTIVVGGPSGIFVIFGIRHFLFLNCDVMKTRFKNHDWNVFHEARRRKTYRAGSKSCISTKMKKKLWSGRRYMNGVLDRLQIDETSRTAFQRNKNEELTDNHLL